MNYTYWICEIIRCFTQPGPGIGLIRVLYIVSFLPFFLYIYSLACLLRSLLQFLRTCVTDFLLVYRMGFALFTLKELKVWKMKLCLTESHSINFERFPLGARCRGRSSSVWCGARSVTTTVSCSGTTRITSTIPQHYSTTHSGRSCGTWSVDNNTHLRYTTSVCVASYMSATQNYG